MSKGLRKLFFVGPQPADSSVSTSPICKPVGPQQLLFVLHCEGMTPAAMHRTCSRSQLFSSTLTLYTTKSISSSAFKGFKVNERSPGVLHFHLNQMLLDSIEDPKQETPTSSWTKPNPTTLLTIKEFFEHRRLALSQSLPSFGGEK